MSNTALEFFKAGLRERQEAGLFREALSLQKLEGEDFYSNDYLNFSQCPELREDLIAWLSLQATEDGRRQKTPPLSSKASRLLGGTQALHEEAEEAVAHLIDRPSALAFPSGYQANVGLIPALAEGAVIFSDQLNHASLIDGIRLSKKSRCHIFRHNNLNHLEDLLKSEQHIKHRKLIVTESLFSMRGDFSPLKEMSSLALKHGALLLVDEAHSTGLFGPELGGRISHLRERDHIISLHTGGKALAVGGAFVGSKLLIRKYLINFCRSFIYSTAASPLLMLQWLSVLRLLKREKSRALTLRKKALSFRARISFPLSESPIVFLPFKAGAKEALQKAQFLRERGFITQAVRFPSVPREEQGIRLSLHFNHREERLKELSELLKQIL